MNIGALASWGAGVLKNAGLDEYRFEAEYLLAECLGVDRIVILTDRDRPADAQQEDRYREMIERRAKREPAAYITGHREFMGLDFDVCPGVLIPRPDTEILTEEVINKAAEKGFASCAEIGLGSGCISVSLAKYTNMRCFGTDISPIALETAKGNAEKNGVGDRTEFYAGDVFDGLPERKFDVIVSNPPYIREKDMEGLMADVRDYEPGTALCGGADGLDFYRKIAAEAGKWLNEGGYIFFEIGFDEAMEVSNILEQNGFEEIKVAKDLSGLDRVVRARKGDFDV